MPQTANLPSKCHHLGLGAPGQIQEHDSHQLLEFRPLHSRLPRITPPEPHQLHRRQFHPEAQPVKLHWCVVNIIVSL